jgi:NAD(P) transhydrogenase subunit alpha
VNAPAAPGTGPSIVPLRVGVLRESSEGEDRVALTPAVVPALLKQGLDVLVETGAGEASGFPDEAYRTKGATIAAREDTLEAELIVRVRITDEVVARLAPGQVIVGLLDPLGSAGRIRDMAERKSAGFALELVPRISRAQAMDVLSSQATVAGYAAVLLGAVHATKLFPLLTTAAGTMPPARVLVVGAGVAGLQAIATARRLGAVVEAYDVRPAVKEEVESLGARFLELPLNPGDASDASGYAKALGEAFYARQRELLTKAVAASDVVVTTALIPGKPAPLLITAQMVAGMAPGSVVVDLAAERGGNCELTRADEVVVTEHGVTVLGPSNPAAAHPHDASQMYAKNVLAFLGALVKEGRVDLDSQDEVIRSTMVCREGEVVHPKVRAALETEGTVA